MLRTVRSAIIGCGGMAQYHIRNMLLDRETTEIIAVCEPSDKAYQATVQIFKERGLRPPPNQPDLNELLRTFSLDAAFIITPHAFHFEQAKSCLEAGLDVLLEKPMVMNAEEARELIRIRDQTGRLLVVAFPGSLSPQVRELVKILNSGEAGKLISIAGIVWQNWGPGTVNTWRQDPKISGGGFLFDTGAHMLNTIADIASEDFVEVAAWLDHHGRPVETLGAIIAKLKSGALVTLHGCGETIPSCASEVYVFCTDAILRTGVWGEKLEIQRKGSKSFRKIQVPSSLGVWSQFIAVRKGELPNPCPPEIGLRMAELYDAIKLSAAQNGKPIQCNQGESK